LYSTCLFCHQSLGANERIEHFPVGQRLAFDAGKGRLWVICSNCLRWNLTPLEERWEAIEECERLYRGQPLRTQTDEIGLVKLSDGVQLVRIGEPLRPEFAAWRYGNVFRARLRRTAAWAGGGTAVVAAGVTAGIAAGVTAATLATVSPVLFIVGGNVFNWISLYRANFRPIYVPRDQGRPYTVFRPHLKEVDLAPGPTAGDWVLNFRHALGAEPLTGTRARRALGVLLTRVNARGALRRSTTEAAKTIGKVGGPEAFLAGLAASSHRLAGDYLQRRARFRRHGYNPDAGTYIGSRSEGPRNAGALPFLPFEQRLALEMAVHEEDERRAMEEELAPLEAAWREAEEVAAIADNLTTSPETEAFIREHRSKKD